MANIYKLRDCYGAKLKTLEKFDDGSRLVAIIGDDGDYIICPQLVNRNGTIIKCNHPH